MAENPKPSQASRRGGTTLAKAIAMAPLAAAAHDMWATFTASAIGELIGLIVILRSIFTDELVSGTALAWGILFVAIIRISTAFAVMANEHQHREHAKLSNSLMTSIGALILAYSYSLTIYRFMA